MHTRTHTHTRNFENRNTPAAPGQPSVNISRLASRALRLAGLVAGLGLTALAANHRSRATTRMASHTSSGPGHLDATTDRTVVFCHACHNEWYEDEHGQELCPGCGSDIIELVRAIPPSPLHFCSF